MQVQLNHKFTQAYTVAEVCIFINYRKFIVLSFKKSEKLSKKNVKTWKKRLIFMFIIYLIHFTKL